MAADTTATPLEQQINGTPGMIYMASTSDNTGAVTIKATFEVGYDPSIGAVDILSRVNTAMPQLPDVAQKTGVSVLKKLPQIMMIVQVSSPDGSRDPIFLSNYASIYLVDELKRIPGVSDIIVGGERKYSYRIWLDPNLLTAMSLTSNDVVQAVKDQNQDVAGGKVGGPPAREGQRFQYQLNMLGRLEKKSQFENIVIRTNPDGSTVRVSDVGRVELGAQDYSMNVKYNGMASIALLIFQTPDSNAMAISQQVTKTLEKAKQYFPSGVEYAISQDTTLFVSASIYEVIETLVIAIILVFLVVYVFLQSLRSTLIPAITIPVSLIGTFLLMAALGFSINTLSLLGLVLAIGLVVDDAIVGGRKCRTAYENEKNGSIRGGPRGNARSNQPDHRHIARFDGGLRTDIVYARSHGRTLQSVRINNCVFGRDFDNQFAHSFAGAVRDTFAHRRKKELVFPKIRPGFELDSRTLYPITKIFNPILVDNLNNLCPFAVLNRLAFLSGAHFVRAGRRSGLLFRYDTKTARHRSGANNRITRPSE